MQQNNFCQRFSFQGHAVRGQVLQLTDEFQAMLQYHDYSSEWRVLLGEAVAANALFSDTIKLEAKILFQMQTQNQDYLLVAQKFPEGFMRCMCRYPESDKASPSTPYALLQGGNLLMTIRIDGQDDMQGVTALHTGALSGDLIEYFEKSEQIPTWVLLASDGKRAAGFLLQRMPSSEQGEEEDNFWEHVVTLAKTLTPDELLHLEPEAILSRLFHEEEVALYEPNEITSGCQCSRERVQVMLAGFEPEELQEQIKRDKVITAKCEFCGKNYDYDEVDIENVWRGGVADDPTSIQH